MDRVSVSPVLVDLSSVFTGSGYRLYLVGGAVRDTFLGKKAEDWDVATNATPEEVGKLFSRIIPTGIEHGTVTIPFRGNMIECTTFRTDQGYSDGRHPDTVLYASTIEEDLSRRDFTMNAIAVSLPDGTVIDPFGGRSDIRLKTIKTVGKPEERFSEDGLRPLRAVRFAAQLQFGIDGATLEAIPKALPVTANVARERIRDEFVKMLSSEKPSTGLRFMETTGILSLIFPELASCRGVDQKGQHVFDVLDHLFHTCDACPRDAIDIRLAGLFHDIGKPRVRATDAHGCYTFYNHESESARIAESIMTRLHFSLKTIKSVCHLVRQHMFHYEPSWGDAAVRRFIVRAGESNIEHLFALRRADCFGITGVRGEPHNLAEFSSRIRDVLEREHAFSLKDLAINGKDLAAAGIPSGPITGLILADLMEAVIEDPALNRADRLLEIAVSVYRAKTLST